MTAYCQQAEVTVVSVGSPRIGDQGFADYYNAHVPRSWRLVDNADAVPAAPPETVPVVGDTGCVVMPSSFTSSEST